MIMAISTRILQGVSAFCYIWGSIFVHQLLGNANIARMQEKTECTGKQAFNKLLTKLGVRFSSKNGPDEHQSHK